MFWLCALYLAVIKSCFSQWVCLLTVKDEHFLFFTLFFTRRLFVNLTESFSKKLQTNLRQFFETYTGWSLISMNENFFSPQMNEWKQFWDFFVSPKKYFKQNFEMYLNFSSHYYCKSSYFYSKTSHHPFYSRALQWCDMWKNTEFVFSVLLLVLNSCNLIHIINYF